MSVTVSPPTAGPRGDTSHPAPPPHHPPPTTHHPPLSTVRHPPGRGRRPAPAVAGVPPPGGAHRRREGLPGPGRDPRRAWGVRPGRRRGADVDPPAPVPGRR